MGYVGLPCIGVVRGALSRKAAEEMIALIARPFPKSRAKRLATECVHSGGTSRNLLVRLISKQISKRKILNQPRETVFQTVANVVEYDQFLPYCTKSELVEESFATEENGNRSFECDLSFAHSQIRETIRHKVETVENESVVSTATETVFWNTLVYDWSFSKLPDNKTEVNVRLDVDIKGLPYAIAFDMLSEPVITKVFDAFVNRVHDFDLKRQ